MKDTLPLRQWFFCYADTHWATVHWSRSVDENRDAVAGDCWVARWENFFFLFFFGLSGSTSARGHLALAVMTHLSKHSSPWSLRIDERKHLTIFHHFCLKHHSSVICCSLVPLLEPSRIVTNSMAITESSKTPVCIAAHRRLTMPPVQPVVTRVFPYNPRR